MPSISISITYTNAEVMAHFRVDDDDIVVGANEICEANAHHSLTLVCATGHSNSNFYFPFFLSLFTHISMSTNFIYSISTREDSKKQNKNDLNSWFGWAECTSRNEDTIFS